MIFDENGTAIHANPACLKFFRATEDEIIGKYNLFRDEALQQKGFISKIRRVFELGEAANIIIDYTLKDFKYVNTKNATHKIINSIFTPIANDLGKVTNVVIQTIDLTDLKTAEKKTIEEKNRAQQYLNVAEVLIVNIDLSGNVQLINPKGCRILGYSNNEIIGKNWFDNFIPEQRRNDVKNVFENIISGESFLPLYFENEISTKSGEERLIAWHNAVIIDEDKNITGVLSSGTDITEQRKVQNELEMHRSNLEKLVEERTQELINKNKQLDDALKVFVGRELIIKELQKRLKSLGGNS